MRVTIVGAGFAGLFAAHELISAGIEVEVFEARGRIGGRVWSQSLPNGVVIERGGEFILDDYAITRDLARRLGVALAPTGMAYGDREPRGGPVVDRAELHRASHTLTAIARERADGLDAALGELLNACPMSPGARAALEARLSISAAHEANELAGRLATHTSSTFSLRRLLERSHPRRVGGSPARPGGFVRAVREVVLGRGAHRRPVGGDDGRSVGQRQARRRADHRPPRVGVALSHLESFGRACPS